ncbi:MAG: L,D-transpeptidase/peptidoglycan binding protein [Actinobacteria bacterium]|nr:L,D-transpeptidase/peptidoglycan binding protein [Actinomycetota bacterium]
MRRALAALAVAAAVLPASAHAQEAPPATIAAGVTVAGLPVEGLTPIEAEAAVQAAFDRGVPLRFKTRMWSVSPSRFGAVPYVSLAVARAMTAEAGSSVPLLVRVSGAHVRAYVASLARRYARAPRSATLSLRDLRPHISPARWGRAVRRAEMAAALTRSLRRLDRPRLRLLVRPVRPAVTRADFGAVVVVRRGSRVLTLYRQTRFVARFRIAVGTPSYPTPLGRFRIVTKERNPTWNPPDSAWAAGMGPIPPGPGNPLGTRWMGLSIPGYGIHGTSAPSSIGTAASHGCIRMYIHQSEWLFERVSVGTPVFIVSA